MVIIVPESLSQAASVLIEFSGITVMVLASLQLTNSALCKVAGRRLSAGTGVCCTCLLFLVAGVLLSSVSVFLAGAAYGLASWTTQRSCSATDSNSSQSS